MESNAKTGSVVRLTVQTGSRTEFCPITDSVIQAIRKSGVRSGLCVVYVPHTTAGVTMNENADADVPRDIIAHLERMVPESGGFRHIEGNSDAHIKASMVGSSATVIIEGGEPMLGRWQGIFFCEFDGPRSREVFIKIQPDAGR